jgi:membrane protein
MNTRIKTLWEHLRHLLQIRIWDQDITRMPRLQAVAFRQLRVGVIFVQGFIQGRIQLRASAMTFATLLALGPVLVIALSIFQAFGALRGLEEQLERFLIDNLSPGSQDQIRVWLYKFFESARAGAFRGLSILVLVGGVLGLLGSLEQAFNDIWGVHRGRSLFQRFSTYTTLMVFGPVLIGLSLSFTTTLQAWTWRAWIEGLPVGIQEMCGIATRLLPMVLTGLAFTLLYTIMPNEKVSLRASLPAGLVAAVLWEASKMGYGAYMRTASHYGTLYGSLAAVPLFLIWVYVTWLVVLFGAQLAFARDAAHDFRLEESALRSSQRERLRVAVHIALATARNYRDELGPPDLVSLAHRLRLPLRLVRNVAEVLVEGGILHLVAGATRETGVVPARSPDRITMYDILTCLANRGTSSFERPATPNAAVAVVDGLLSDLDAGAREQWGMLTLNDVLDEQDLRSNQELLLFPNPERRAGLLGPRSDQDHP